MTDFNLELENTVLEYIKLNLAPELAAHLISTRDYALFINKHHSLGLDETGLALACLCHDLARLYPVEKLMDELAARGIDPKQYKFESPVLYHGVVSAEIAREQFGIENEQILDAVRWHATGRDGMSLLEKVVYIADKLEMSRIMPGVKELRNEVMVDFEKGFTIVVRWVLKHVVDAMLPLDYNSVAAYNRGLKDLIERNQI